jgi:Zn-dependent protease
MSTSQPDSPDGTPLPGNEPQPLYPPEVLVTSSYVAANPFAQGQPEADNPSPFAPPMSIAAESIAAEALLASEQRLARYRAWKRRQLGKSLLLFGLTFLSTYLVGGLSYAAPVMLILLAHEMGHYLQSVRYNVPASLPYFIPMPLTPLGTMGAVIFQGRGTATRRQMFDIAVSGPLAGLAVTFPVLWIGLATSRYAPLPSGAYLEFGDPLIMTWLMEFIHGPLPPGQGMLLNSIGFAGWVGVLLTALNLLPVGQLDGGHIAYTLLGRRAHLLAMLTVAAAIGMIVFQKNYSYVLLVVLMLLTGIRHPPTADDSESLGWFRHVVGWLTLSFLILGMTPNPMMLRDSGSAPAAPAQQQPPELAQSPSNDF